MSSSQKSRGTERTDLTLLEKIYKKRKALASAIVAAIAIVAFYVRIQRIFLRLLLRRS